MVEVRWPYLPRADFGSLESGAAFVHPQSPGTPYIKLTQPVILENEEDDAVFTAVRVEDGDLCIIEADEDVIEVPGAFVFLHKTLKLSQAAIAENLAVLETTSIPLRLRDLMLTFPVLTGAPMGNLRDLVMWGHRCGSGGRHAVIFILSVWNEETPEAAGFERFDVHGALAAWDRGQRVAFIAWAQEPWWC